MRVIDPATEEEIAVVEAGSPDEVVAQAKRAFEPWRRCARSLR